MTFWGFPTDRDKRSEYPPRPDGVPKCADCLAGSGECLHCDAPRCELDGYPLINDWCTACDAIRRAV